MERVLPIRNLEGTDFIVDVANRELRELTDPANIMYFDGMHDYNDHYAFTYDTGIKNIQAQGQDPVGTLVHLSLPQMAVLDPVGMSLRFATPVEELAGRADHDIIRNNPIVVARMAGQLPTLDLAGDLYLVDGQKMNLIMVENNKHIIGLEQMPFSEDGENFRFYYDTGTHRPVEIDPTLTVNPPGVILVTFPHLLKMDSVGYARAYGMKDTGMLVSFPPDKSFTAVVTQFEQTHAAEIIRRNREGSGSEAPGDDRQKGRSKYTR